MDDYKKINIVYDWLPLNGDTSQIVSQKCLKLTYKITEKDDKLLSLISNVSDQILGLNIVGLLCSWF